jgi:DNA-binding transcriptional MocR family regulator
MLELVEHVIYVGGLSKTLSSSLRVGCVVASHAIIKDLVDIKMLTSIGGSRFAEAVAVALLERGAYRKYLERLRRRMRDALGSTIRTLEDAGWEIFEKPVGGKFVWARVPHVGNAERLVECGSGFMSRLGMIRRRRHFLAQRQSWKAIDARSVAAWIGRWQT